MHSSVCAVAKGSGVCQATRDHLSTSNTKWLASSTGTPGEGVCFNGCCPHPYPAAHLHADAALWPLRLRLRLLGRRRVVQLRQQPLPGGRHPRQRCWQDSRRGRHWRRQRARPLGAARRQTRDHCGTHDLDVFLAGRRVAGEVYDVGAAAASPSCPAAAGLQRSWPSPPLLCCC